MLQTLKAIFCSRACMAEPCTTSGGTEDDADGRKPGDDCAKGRCVEGEQKARSRSRGEQGNRAGRRAGQAKKKQQRSEGRRQREGRGTPGRITTQRV